jgi:type I restriction enzyme S subunit
MSNLDAGKYYPIDLDKMPKCWLATYVGKIAVDIQPGFACGEHNSTGVGVPHIRPMNINREGGIDLSEIKYVSPEKPLRLRHGDVLFNNTNSPALIGKTTAITREEDWAFSNHMTRINLQQGMDNRFVAFQLHFLWMSGYFRHRCVNHVNQASISTKTLSDTVPLVVAPSLEQERIAIKIEELISDLDAGVAALERAKANLKRYRTAVLKAAVEGRLTEDWRKKNSPKESAAQLLQRILKERRKKWEKAQLAAYAKSGKSPPKNWKDKYKEPTAPDTSNLPELPKGWCWAILDQILVYLRNGYFQSPSSAETGTPILRINAVRPMQVDFSEVRFLDTIKGNVDDYFIQNNDLLFTRYNGSVDLLGVVGMVRGCTDKILHPDKLIRVKLAIDNPLPSFVEIAANVGISRKHMVGRARTTAGQTGISGTDVREMPILLPPLDEQIQIVVEVAEKLSQIKAAETIIEHGLQRAARLRQSILKRAFEGKLVPQDPRDEPATVLLGKIKASTNNGNSKNPIKSSRKK